MSSSVVTNIASLNVGLETTLARLSSGLCINTLNITTQRDAGAAVSASQAAVQTLGTVQSAIGAAMKRVQYAVSKAQTLSVGMAVSESRIREADIAQEAANLTKFDILNQSGLAALARSNQENASGLSLLK
jgi:flagellin